MPFDRRGPFLEAAFLCEKILVEKDDVKSAIRIFDRTTRPAPDPNAPQEMEPFDYQMVLFIRFKSGEAHGLRELRVQFARPGGDGPAPWRHRFYFEAGELDTGVDFVLNLELRITTPGMHWFHVFLDDAPVTSVPWRVVYGAPVQAT